MTSKELLRNFIVESNKIEGITRGPTDDEISIGTDFLKLPLVRVSNLENFVQVCQPGAHLRNKKGMNVAVGNYYAPRGGPEIEFALEKLLAKANNDEDPYHVHLKYETLHPFMDGNGRSGRILWAWQMLQTEGWAGLKLGFLHTFYYQTLEHSKEGEAHKGP